MELISAFLEILVSNSRLIACALMILAHLINGAMLTLFYPFAVFCYALLEESRPAKWFWNLVIVYTLVFVFIRFTTQNDIVEESYLYWMQKYYIGLEPVKKGWSMITYILCEIAIVCAANLAKMNTDLLGLAEKDEIDYESVSNAMKRFIENSTISARFLKAQSKRNKIEEEEAKNLEDEFDGKQDQLLTLKSHVSAIKPEGVSLKSKKNIIFSGSMTEKISKKVVENLVLDEHDFKETVLDVPSSTK